MSPITQFGPLFVLHFDLMLVSFVMRLFFSSNESHSIPTAVWAPIAIGHTICYLNDYLLGVFGRSPTKLIAHFTM